EGHPTAEYSNHAHSTSTTIATDGDCDGPLTAEDCNDSDSTSTTIATDADCDGTLTAADCNDSDASVSDPDGQTQSCPGQSCLEILNNGYSTGNGSFWIDPEGDGSGAFEVYCDMGTSGGGWTLVLMTRESDHATFRYDSQYWTTTALLNETTTDPSADTNLKNLAYNTLAFTEIRLDMTNLGNSHIISTSQTSAHALFTGSHYDPGVSRTEYLDWIDESNSNWDNQSNCNVKGFQVGVGQPWSCRYGINMNNENDCSSNDAAVGFGCHTQNYGVSYRIISCGGFRWNHDARYGRKGWIFVR
ncbi:MAG: fibrinogen-like YCDxxxxGGGW domain-containing protein, partial [Myxococcota bacterium]|nr:fibrinogen-like YCDxxxxGGGW domain-containing protein [Myxococcota bacterium]